MTSIVFLYYLFFYYRSDEFVKLPPAEFSKIPPIIRHFIYFRFWNQSNIKQLSFPTKPDNFDSPLDPITWCIWFILNRDSRKLSTIDENTIINDILEFIFTNTSAMSTNCYFTYSLFLFFSHKCRNQFFKDQLNMIISKTKICPEKLNFFVNILENYKP